MAMNNNVFALAVLCLSFTVFLSNVALAVDPQVPCYFVFGDSLADPGNNNNLKTIAKANYPPYGVDFPGAKPTGRFTNGRTYVDFIAQSLGFTSFIPSIANAAVGKFIGVNYASGAAGILDDTGKTNGDRIAFGKQVAAHQRIVNQLPGQLKLTEEDVTSLLNKCIYTIGIGSNDYVNNYFVPESYDSHSQYTPAAFANLLVAEHNQLIQSLYDLGARKMAFVGVGHIGFTPYELNLQWPGVQNATVLNNAVDLFNDALKSSINSLSIDLPGSILTYLNNTGIASDGPAVPLSAIASCCQHIDTASQITCKSGDSAICSDRSKALFFDNIHTTEAVNQALAARYYSAKNPSDAIPYDIQTLASL